MIQSMTGFGKASVQLPEKKITIELRSLNNKNIDINSRIPATYKEKEVLIRSKIAKALIRGKIDFNLFIEITGEQTSTTINHGIVQQYIQQLKTITKLEDGFEIELIKMAIQMPDALKTERTEIDPNELSQVMQLATKAIEELVKFRKNEGKSLEVEFDNRIENISKLLNLVKKIDPNRIKEQKQRLEKSVTEIKEKVDLNRFEQELIYYIEKLDITEEIVRLDNHLLYFKQTLLSEESSGKKLGFIAQEIGREINTIGAKANYAPMQKTVVQMKDELEKIKEQLLNVL